MERFSGAVEGFRVLHSTGKSAPGSSVQPRPQRDFSEAQCLLHSLRALGNKRCQEVLPGMALEVPCLGDPTWGSLGGIVLGKEGIVFFGYPIQEEENDWNKGDERGGV